LLLVLEFLQFPLSVIAGTATRHSPLSFFSRDELTVHDTNPIQTIVVPPAATVAELVAACKVAVLSGSKSIIRQHVPPASLQHFPLWIIPYWTEVLELCTTSRKAWVKAEEFLRKRKRVWKKSVSRQSADKVMQQAYDVLSCLPWLGNICGFDNDQPLHKLAL
jgi:hypothetical protein